MIQCLDNLRKIHFNYIAIYSNQLLNANCIVFLFIRVDTRITDMNTFNEITTLTEGKCILVRVHSETSNSYYSHDDIITSHCELKYKYAENKLLESDRFAVEIEHTLLKFGISKSKKIDEEMV